MAILAIAHNPGRVCRDRLAYYMNNFLKGPPTRSLKFSAFRIIDSQTPIRDVDRPPAASRRRAQRPHLKRRYRLCTRVGAMRAARIMPIDIISPSLGPAKLSSRRSAERASGAQQVLDAVSASRTLLLSLRRCPHNQPPSAAITRPAGRREQIHDRGNTDMSLRQAVSLSS
jgi:hypothetical protein